MDNLLSISSFKGVGRLKMGAMYNKTQSNLFLYVIPHYIPFPFVLFLCVLPDVIQHLVYPTQQSLSLIVFRCIP